MSADKSSSSVALNDIEKAEIVEFQNKMAAIQREVGAIQIDSVLKVNQLSIQFQQVDREMFNRLVGIAKSHGVDLKNEDVKWSFRLDTMSFERPAPEAEAVEKKVNGAKEVSNEPISVAKAGKRTSH